MPNKNPCKEHTNGYTKAAGTGFIFLGKSIVTAQRIVQMYVYGIHHILKPAISPLSRTNIYNGIKAFALYTIVSNTVNIPTR